MNLYTKIPLLKNKNVKKYIKLSKKIIQDKYLTYFISVITLIIVSETFRNPDQKLLLILKDIFNITAIK